MNYASSIRWRIETIVSFFLAVLVCLVAAECEIGLSSDWCCSSAQSWCEANQYLLLQVVFGFALYLPLCLFISRHRLWLKVVEISSNGTALPAKVRSTSSQAVDDNGYVVEYAALVEYSHDKTHVVKWVRIGKPLYKKLRRKQQPPHPLTLPIYSLPQQPETAVVGDASVEELGPVRTAVLGVIMVTALTLLLVFFWWFLRTYKNHRRAAASKLIVMALAQMLVAAASWKVIDYFDYTRRLQYMLKSCQDMRELPYSWVGTTPSTDSREVPLLS